MTALAIAHYVGWAILGCMAVLSASIVGPGLVTAIRIVFPAPSASHRNQLRVVEGDAGAGVRR